MKETMVIVKVVGPDGRRSRVRINEDATVADVASSKYELFWRTLKKNGKIVPLTEGIRNGDVVTVEDEPVDED